MSVPVTIPLLNPNEPEALLAALHIGAGQYVAAGTMLCTLETTKSTAELSAEVSGFVIGLCCQAGQTVRAGDLFCYLADSPDEPVPAAGSGSTETAPTSETATGSKQELPAGLRITQPALALAQQNNLDLGTLPLGPLVTEQIVRAHLQGTVPRAAFSPPKSAFDPTAVIVYGGGGHGKSLIDLLRSLGTYRIVGVVDDGIAQGESILGLPVLGNRQVLAELYERGVRLAVNAVGGIGNVAIRVKVFQQLAAAGFACPAVVHPAAFVEASAILSPGVQVFPHAYIGSDARIGFGAIVNTGAIVSHDCRLGDYANVSPGAMLAGEVQAGTGVLVGMGATINLQVRLGQGARIGNGATVKTDVPENGVVRAGSVWPD